MVNEELLERAERIACDANGDDEFVFAKVIFDLVDLVCALRKDRERLDWLEMEMAIEFEDGKYRALFRQNMPITREAIDAALSARGGEDGA